MVLNFDVSVEMDADVSGGVERAQRARLEDSMDKGFAVSQEKVPVDRGTLKQSGYPPTWNGNVLEWGYAAAHAIPMEEGTQPFWAPIKPLKEWARRVTGDAGFGYYVQQKIAKEGIEPQPYASPGAKAAERYLKNNSLGKYLDKEL
jgi:hypothetical protein